MQDFPADDYTCGLIPTSCDAVWRVELKDDQYHKNRDLPDKIRRKKSGN